MAIVELRDVHKIYHVGKESVHALAGVSLRVNQGEFLSVMGRSGSGKSTLLNIIGCLDRPTRGEVVIGGVNTNSLRDGRLADIRSRRIGFVFQMHNLIPIMTALENVMLPMKYAGLRNRRERALEMLERVGLADRVKYRASDLSGGQRQRVAIARALSTNPDIVLADEPTGQLDSQLSAQIMSLLRSLNLDLGQTFVIVTHDPTVAEQTDRTIRVLDGKIAGEEIRPLARPEGPPSEAASNALAAIMAGSNPAG
ncbi:MAG TPA: ABC transporter ATP-binding protein [Chloroflexota bacterium]|nr:ABC transporter ATP-binding protein [Chloroflexota bacterium]